MIEIFRDTKFDFVGRRKIAYAISAVLVALGLVEIVQIARGRAELGIDFAGGTLLQVLAEPAAPTADVRRALESAGFREVSVQEAGPGRSIIRVRRNEQIPTGQVAVMLQKALAAGLAAGTTLQMERSEEVGPVVGRALQRQALSAIFFSTLGILGYIAWRFDFRFGVAATLATLHDVLAALGYILLTGTEVTLLIVSAVLTLAGYSLTDTVVVFDRIRENLRSLRRETFENIVNLSLNDTLSRTIITGGATLLATLAVLFFAGPVVRDFAKVLVYGIVVGTYSSIFVASPLLIEWRRMEAARAARVARGMASR
ncbi:MAG: protein translocase subunit SecF [bacterium]